MNSELTNNKQSNDNKVDSPLSWIIASLGQVAHFTSVVIRKVLATSGWVRSAHTAPYAKSAHNSRLTKFAFTLAETLVVMGIIGVVAALTIPNLNQSTGDKEKVAKVKKIYSNLDDAFGRAIAVYGPYKTWFINDVKDGKPDYKARSIRVANRMTEFMKVSKNCGVDGTGCFFSGAYKALYNDKTHTIFNNDMQMFLLADGTALAFDGINIYVDIDGAKGANTFGKDYFIFGVYSQEDFIEPQFFNMTEEEIKDKCFIEGAFCAPWVIETGNMDYLKANEGVCPNGTELSWENTSCK